MFFARRFVSLLLVASSLLIIMPAPRAARAQDLVASEDIAGGSSVFVFRESRKKPQVRSAGRPLNTGRSRAARSNAQIAAAAQKRRATSAAARKREAVARATRKEALSNTLTAKADDFLDKRQAELAIINYR